MEEKEKMEQKEGMERKADMEQKTDPSEAYMAKIIGVRFREGGKLYNFDPGGLDLRAGERVIVETENGLVCGKVVGGMQQVSLDYLKKRLKKVKRKVTEEDQQVLRDNKALGQTAKNFCRDRIRDRKMQMKLVDVEYVFDSSKAVFFFTADGRVDFRELVKDLAARLRVRIEMRQIGVRDEAKMIGGYGCCGKEYCCKTFVREFDPVSIKMAKQQNLTLNPSKISGACGRLMCCLSYEKEVYSSFRKGLPKLGKTIETPEGPAKVCSHNVLKETMTVLTKDGRFLELQGPELSMLRQGRPLVTKSEPAKKAEAVSSEKKYFKKERTGPVPDRRKGRPQSPATPKKGTSEGAPEQKEGFLSKFKKLAGGDKKPEEQEKKKRRRRRRRGRFRGEKRDTTAKKE